MKMWLPVTVLLIIFGCQSDRANPVHFIEVGGIFLPDTLLPASEINERYDSGEGYVVQNYKIDDDIIDRILDQKHFDSLPFMKNEVIDNRIYDYMADEDSGYYSVVQLDDKDPRDQIVIILNTKRMELTIMIVYV
jgi:hypothetical protein